jgi:hypothetical protein
MLQSLLSRAAPMLAAMALLCPWSTAQGPTPAPATVLNALSASGATVQDLNLPQTRQRFQLQIWLGDQPAILDLRPNDVRASDFRLLVADANGIQQVPTPPSVTWRGEVLGYPDSDVAAALTADGLDALVWLDHDGAMWGIQPSRKLDPSRPASEHVVYAADQLDALPVQCGVDHTHVPVPVPSTGFGTDARKIAEIAIDCDLEYYQRFNRNVTQVQNQVTTILNGVDTIYQRDVDIEYRVTTILVRTARTYSQTNMSNLLSEFRNYWNINQGATQRDVAHLFTGKGSFSGVIGITYLGVVCNRSQAYGVDKAFSSSLTANVALVSHELGHDWNAIHCDSSANCRIMCSGLGGCTGNITSFGPTSTNAIVAFKNTRNCLDDPAPPTITSVTPAQVQAFTRPPVTVTGTNLGGVSQVTVGTQNAGFAVIDSSTLSVAPPKPLALGQADIRATSGSGASNAAPFAYTETIPTQFVTPNFGLSGFTLEFDMGANPDDLWWMLVSFNDPTTVPFLGYDVLLNHVVLTQGQLDAAGLGELDFPVPPNLGLTGLIMSVQLVLIGETNLQLAEVTAVRSVNFLL